jgi:hypothetical protein
MLVDVDVDAAVAAVGISAVDSISHPRPLRTVWYLTSMGPHEQTDWHGRQTDHDPPFLVHFALEPECVAAEMIGTHDEDNRREIAAIAAGDYYYDSKQAVVVVVVAVVVVDATLLVVVSFFGSILLGNNTRDKLWQIELAVVSVVSVDDQPIPCSKTRWWRWKCHKGSAGCSCCHENSKLVPCSMYSFIYCIIGWRVCVQCVERYH